jgi:hypothetical protein
MTSIVCKVDSRLKAERNEQDQQRHSLQFVPAKIEFNGAEKIGPFFNDFIKDNQDGSFSTALRGRPLTGHSVPMPDGYKALVMQTESGDRLSERSELKSRLVKTLSQMTVWNYDASSSVDSTC